MLKQQSRYQQPVLGYPYRASILAFQCVHRLYRRLSNTLLPSTDFQPITVLVPGGEEFPFTFSSKSLNATADGSALTTSTDFEGTYRTPSYRTSNFIDPKGRALTTGVQYAQGLVALGGDDEQLEKDNNKRYIDGVGTMSLSITKVDPETGEFAGVFSAIQPSDSDMGGREVVDIKITGDLYGRLGEA